MLEKKIGLRASFSENADVAIKVYLSGSVSLNCQNSEVIQSFCMFYIEWVSLEPVVALGDTGDTHMM